MQFALRFVQPICKERNGSGSSRTHIEASGNNSDAKLVNIFEQHMLPRQICGDVDVSAEKYVKISAQIASVIHKEPISEHDYTYIIKAFAKKSQMAHIKPKSTTYRLHNFELKAVGIKLMRQLLTGPFVKIVELQKCSASKNT